MTPDQRDFYGGRVAALMDRCMELQDELNTVDHELGRTKVEEHRKQLVARYMGLVDELVEARVEIARGLVEKMKRSDEKPGGAA